MRLLIIDDHPLVLAGLREVIARLDAHAEVFTESDPHRALAFVLAEPALDLILVDLWMPRLDGFTFLKALGEHGIWTPVAVISGATEARDVQAALDAGALAFIPKSSPSAVFAEALRAVLNGRTWVPDPGALARLDAASPGGRNTGETRAPSDDFGLSERQIEVLALAAEGHANKVIARLLNVSEHTVKAHLSAAFRALGAGNRTECVRRARAAGLISD